MTCCWQHCVRLNYIFCEMFQQYMSIMDANLCHSFNFVQLAVFMRQILVRQVCSNELHLQKRMNKKFSILSPINFLEKSICPRSPCDYSRAAFVKGKRKVFNLNSNRRMGRMNFGGILNFTSSSIFLRFAKYRNDTIFPTFVIGQGTSFLTRTLNKKYLFLAINILCIYETREYD